MYVAIRASGVVVQLVRTLPCHARSLFACISWFIGDSTSGSAKNRLSVCCRNIGKFVGVERRLSSCGSWVRADCLRTMI